MKTVTKWMMLAAICGLSACTNENETGGTNGTDNPPLENIQREVLLTFKNKLTTSQAATKAETPIATPQENTVASLDVYVFASDSETGNYTFQERLAYRQNEGDMPAGAKELEVQPTDKENEFATLLKLQKGLFVKLYCIANQPLLVDPANEGNVITDTYFQPLIQTTPGQAGSKVGTEGVPSESLFQSFHTPFITAAGDTLVCPLPMSGAYTQPLDLTDYSVSSRMQVGFKLTRAVARFDIINNASLSRFTIDSIGMSNGRKAVTFFPIQVYGDQPTAQPDELITYPLRAFAGEKANAGIQTGAFYSYPSPSSDGGKLVLKGRYKINETETKVTSYPVAFKQITSNGNGAYLEILPNSRYTLAITEADEYNLQANIQVADWTDDGSIDEYNPAENKGKIAVTLPDGFKDKSTWDAATRTVSMSLETGSNADVSVSTNSTIIVNKRYTGKDQRYDWLEVSAPTVTAATKAITSFGYRYTLALKDGYNKGRYPKATLRFIDAVSGNENIVFVEAVASPELIEIPKVPDDTNLNSINIETLTASIYRTTGSSLQIKFLCPDGVDLESAPAWLKVEKTKENGAETTFTLTLTDRDVADTEGTLTFHNVKKPDDLKTDITVILHDAGIVPAFNNLGGNGNSFTAAHDGALDDIRMPVKEGNRFTIGTTSIQGVQVAIDFDGGSEWLKHDGEAYIVPASNTSARLISTGEETAASPIPATMKLYAGNKKTEISFSLDNSKLAGGKTATVTLKNKTGGKDYQFTVTPVYNIETVSIQSATPADDKLENTNFTFYKLPSTASSATIRIVSYGGSKIEYTGTGVTLPAITENSGNESNYVLTITGAGNGTLKVSNYTDPSQFIEYRVTVLKSAIEGNTGVTLTASGGQTATVTVTSGLGGNATVSSWNGGNAWFDLTSSTFNNGTQNIGLRIKSNITSITNIKNATVTLTNKITNGGNLTITVTPNLLAPTLSSASGSVTNITGSNVRTFTVSAVGGGITIKSNSNAAVATANLNQSNRTVTVTSKKAGSTVITVANASDLSKTVTYSFSVTGIDYNGAAVNSITNYYVAPVTAGNLTYDELSPRLSSICPSGWHVPSRDELFDMIGETSGSVWLGPTTAITAVINAFGSTSCWSSTQGGCYLINGNTIMVTGGRPSTERYSVRCIRHK